MLLYNINDENDLLNEEDDIGGHTTEDKDQHEDL